MHCATCMFSKSPHTNSALSRHHPLLEVGVSPSVQHTAQPCTLLPLQLVSTVSYHLSWLQSQVAAEAALLHGEGEAAAEEFRTL
jgi:hypothetical protein